LEQGRYVRSISNKFCAKLVHIEKINIASGVNVTRKAKIVLHLLSSIAAILVTSVEFDFIRDFHQKRLVLIILSLAVLGNFCLSVYTNLYPSRRDASSVIKKALDLACLLLGQGRSGLYRANVFTPMDSSGQTLGIKYYSTNMTDARDIKIRLDKWQGATGLAWGYKTPIVANLGIEGVKGGASWGLTPEQVEITASLEAILAYPIRHPKKVGEFVGILSFDTHDKPPEDFFEEGSRYLEIASTVSKQIGELLFEFGQLGPSSDG
jgi:hypothetical protein